MEKLHKADFLKIGDDVVTPELKNKIKEIIHSFPEEGLMHIFAYGSGVFKQEGRDLGNMIDLIFVVNDVEAWHARNFQANSDHYSKASLLGSRLITHIQENFGCGIYYNTYAQVCGATVKYGVIGMHAFEEDLVDWKHMYVAGRLQKPVLQFDTDYTYQNSLGDTWIRIIQDINHRNAVRLALLLLPERFSLKEFYLTIAGISYTGDSRMLLGGEKESKIAALVLPLITSFDAMYLEYLLSLTTCYLVLTDEGDFIQSIDESSRVDHLAKIPLTLQKKLVEFQVKEQSSFFECPRVAAVDENAEQTSVALTELSKRPDLPQVVQTCLSKIVFGASVRQTIVGFFSTGFRNSIYYAYEKYTKSKETKPIGQAAQNKSK